MPAGTTTPAASIPMQKVLFINRSYWPDAEATGQLLTELCEDLAGRLDVSVLAGQPNQNPRGESFRASGRETRNGVTIERVRHPQFAKRGLIGRGLNLVGFLVASFWRSLWVPRPDVVIVESDPFLLPLLGLWLKVMRGCRFVAYLQDLYPDIAVALGKVREGLLTRTLRSLLRFALRRADRIVVPGEDMRDRLIAWGLPAARIEVIPNWVDTAKIFPVKSGNRFRLREAPGETFLVMHSGNMGLSQQLSTLVDAAALLRDQPQFLLLLVGGGGARADLERQTTKLGLTNVRFLPYQPREELAESLSAADVQIVSTDPAAYPCLMPSKLYGVLAAGTSVLAVTAAESEVARVVQRHRVGRVVTPGSAERLAEALRDAMSDRTEAAAEGARARDLAVRLYDRAHPTARFATLLETLLPSAGSTASASEPGPASTAADVAMERF